MQTAGYVLAGGASSRMGENKAFLMLAGRPLIAIAAEAVREAAGTVTIIGPPELYRSLGYSVIPDLRANVGPLGGIETALSHTTSDWNLVVACDMPRVSSGTLRRILAEAMAHPDASCVVPESAAGRLEPLCAAYHRCLLSAVAGALSDGIRKVTAALPPQSIHSVSMADDPAFQNVNTPEEWRLALRP